MSNVSGPDSRTGITDELAVEIAKLGMVRESSEMGALGRLTELAARAVPGCAGATTIRWSLTDPPQILATAASHPDLAELTEVQRVRREGPSFSAVLERAPVSCDDTLVETRWPDYVGAALRRGVRCFATTLYENNQVLLSLGLYGVLPKALDPRRLAVAALLVAQSGAAVTNTREAPGGRGARGGRPGEGYPHPRHGLRRRHRLRRAQADLPDPPCEAHRHRQAHRGG